MFTLTRRNAILGTLALGTASLLSACHTGVKVSLPEGDIVVDTTNENIKSNIESSYVLSDGTHREERLKEVTNIATKLVEEAYQTTWRKGADSPEEGFITVYQHGKSSYAEFNADWVLDAVLKAEATTKQGTALNYAEGGLESAVKSVLVPVIYTKEDTGTYAVHLLESFTGTSPYLKRSENLPTFGKDWKRPEAA